jgi:hypothetical protein
VIGHATGTDAPMRASPGLRRLDAVPVTCGGRVERVTVERVTGIEPAWPAWKAGALPLSYTREAGTAVVSARFREES